jgi:N-acetylmuramoyl-L-alanine amidase
MKRILASTLALISVLGVASPALAATAYPIGTVNIRSGPGTQYSVVGALYDGQRATVLSHEGTWLKVQTGGGTVGYMADWVTREVFDTEATYLQVDTDVLNVRSAPGLDAAVVGQVKQGDQLRLLETLAGWYKVDAGAAGTGWVKGEYTYRVTNPPATSPPPPTTPPPDQTPPQPPRQGLTKQVQAMASTVMRVGRSTDYDVVSYIRLWERLTYVDSAEGWVKVQNAAGDRGWVNGKDLNLTDLGMDFSLQAMYTVKENNWAMAYWKVREVNAWGEGLALRQGPAPDSAAVRALHTGDRMKILSIPGGDYVQVMLPDGATGWLSREFLRMAPGMPTESVTLTQAGPGVLRLELSGLAAPAQVSAADGVLSVGLAESANRHASLQIGQSGVTGLEAEAGRLAVRFEISFRYQVLEQSTDRLLIEIRPVVATVEKVTQPDRAIYHFRVAGAVTPSAQRAGTDIAFTLPGARLAAGAAVPQELTLTQTATGLAGKVTSNRAFAIKVTAEGFDLVLYAPGLAGKTVVVDPGHGGVETGAVGSSGMLEKDVNLAIALKLKPLLEAAGARVIMTRTSDSRCASPAELATVPLAEQLRYDLNCRTVVPNTGGADIFLSIHNNANPSRMESGTETYFSWANLNAPESKVLATGVQAELTAALGLQSRGVKSEDFYVVKYTNAPAMLAEVAFLSNSTDEALLKQDAFRQKTAEALFRGLQRFFNAQQ